jgi:hypothetical protein
MWVAFAFALVFTVSWKLVFFISLAVLTIWVIVGVVLMRRNKAVK